MNNIYIGKVTKYDGVTGRINTVNSSYLFAYTVIEDSIKVGDIVTFKLNEHGFVREVKVFKNIDYGKVLDDIDNKFKEQVNDYNKIVDDKKLIK